MNNNKSPPQAGGNFENNKIPPRSGGNFFGNNKTPDRKSGQKILKGGVFIVIPAVTVRYGDGIKEEGVLLEIADIFMNLVSV